MSCSLTVTVFEAAVTPGFALFTSQWYTKREQGTRVGIWFSFNGWAQIFGGLVAYGIAKGTSEHPAALAGWKIVFLFTGLLTATIGVIFWFTMPDNQLNARWLSKEDRVLAIERIRINQQGVGNKHFKMYQLREALLDPLTWAFFFYALVADIPNGTHSTSAKIAAERRLTLFRWHLKLLQSAHHFLRLHEPAVTAIRYAWRRSRDRHACRLRLPWRQAAQPHLGRYQWLDHCHHRHGAHCWPAN